MNLTTEYIKRIKKESEKSNDGWNIVRINNPDIEFEKTRINKFQEILNSNYNLDNEKDLELKSYFEMKDRGSFKRLLELLEDSLMYDLNVCIDIKHKNLLNKTIISLIPLRQFDAFSSSKDEFGENLDGYAIIINQGLYFSLNFLANTYILEQLQGELLKYKTKGNKQYHYAIEMFLNPSLKLIQETWLKGLPADILGEINAYQSVVQINILLFITLHEFGHIANNDIDTLEMYKLHMSNITGDTIDNSNIQYEKYWNSEYLADKFALEGLCRRAKSNISAWANFLFIYLFFIWLSDIERKNNKSISLFHPPPLNRAEKLRKYMTKRYGKNDNIEPYFDWLIKKSKDWRK